MNSPNQMPDPERKTRDALVTRLEQGFDRQALLPRFVVLIVLAAAAFLEYGHGHRIGHWTALLVYGLTTIALAHPVLLGRSQLPWVATVVDAILAVYVIVDHFPRGDRAGVPAAETVTLLPAFLLLLQTGLRLRRDLLIVFVGLVLSGWVVSLSVYIFRGNWDSGHGGVVTQQALGLLSFAASAGFVFYAAHRMREGAIAASRANLDSALLARFLPDGVAADIVRGDGSAQVARRHVCLATLDLRGFSAITRDQSGPEAVRILMQFRTLAHDAISTEHGIVDKYLGDGVLAVFLRGALGDQADSALTAVNSVFGKVASWNAAQPDGRGRMEIIAALHAGDVLAGVIDDGRRAEFTVLGPAMNALSRMERRAKEAGESILVSKEFLHLLDGSARDGAARPLARREGVDDELPDVFAVSPLNAARLGDNRAIESIQRNP
ncbi:MAG: adenylate/guanylate cyclase domain-containing protein [Casimicrobiaceae bacterium]